MPTPRRARLLLYAGLVVSVVIPLVWFGVATLVWARTNAVLEDGAERRCAQRFSDASSLRLLFLGDSFTAGDGSESNLGFWAYLPDALAAEGIEGAEVLSLATSGATTAYQREQLDCWLTTSNQAVSYVVVTGGVNDASSLRYHRDFLAEFQPERHPASVRFLYGLPRPILLGIHYPVLLQRRLRTPRAQPFDDAPSDAGWVPLIGYHASHPAYEDWALLHQQGQLRAMHEAVEEAGARLIVGAYSHHEDHSVVERMGGWIRYVEPRELRDHYEAQGWFAPDGWHLSDAGARDYARRWARWFAAGQR